MKIISIITSMVICVSSYALTLGKINVHSGLDQKLNASIIVDFLPDGKNISWRVNADAMGRKINGLRYKFQQDSEMNTLTVMTDQPIHFPVITLNVLANVDGKQVAADEFTVLLDPVNKPVPMKIKKYGPIVKGESLEEVTKKVKPNYITMDNASNALFYANPHAFENNDPSKVIPGSFLIIPDFSEGISAVGSNSISNAKITKIEEQLGLIVSEVSNNNKVSVQKYTELSEYTLNLEKLVTTLASRITSLESGTSFLVEDITKQAKSQQKAMKDISSQIQKNHELVIALQEKSQLWFYIGFAIIAILVLVAAFIWWKKRKQDQDDEGAFLDLDSDVLEGDDEIQVDEQEKDDSDESKNIDSIQIGAESEDSSEIDFGQDELENIDSSIVDKSDAESGISQIEINEKQVQDSEKVEGYHDHFLGEESNDGTVFISQEDDVVFQDSDSKIDAEILSEGDDDPYPDQSDAIDQDKALDNKDIDNVIVVNKSDNAELSFDEQEPDLDQVSENEYNISAKDDESLTDLELELEKQSKLEIEANNKSENNDLETLTDQDIIKEIDINSAKDEIKAEILDNDQEDTNRQGDAEDKSGSQGESDKDNNKGKKKNGGLSLTPLDLNQEKDK